MRLILRGGEFNGFKVLDGERGVCVMRMPEVLRLVTPPPTGFFSLVFLVVVAFFIHFRQEETRRIRSVW